MLGHENFKSMTLCQKRLADDNTYNWDKVFKNGIRKICGGQPLKNLKGYGLLN